MSLIKVGQVATVTIFSLSMLSCSSGGMSANVSSRPGAAPATYKATYSYISPTLNPGDGIVEVAASSILQCINETTNEVVANSLCVPPELAEKKIFKSPAGTLDVPIDGAVDSKAVVNVAIGEFFDPSSTSGKSKIENILVCDVAHEKNGATCPAAFLKAKKIKSSSMATCVVTLEDKVKCWGSMGASKKFMVPTEVPEFNGVKDFYFSGGTLCVITLDSKVKCLGKNTYGELGLGDTTERTVLIEVPGFSGAVKLLNAYTSVCAIFSDTSVKCAGLNSAGQLGLGDTTDRHSPTLVPNFFGATNIFAGGNSSAICITKADGRVFCSGYAMFNTSLNLPGVTTPVEMAGFQGSVEVVVGGTAICGKFSDGSVKCMGYNFNGNLGDGTQTDRKTDAVSTGFSNIASLSMDYYTTCGVSVQGVVKCAGLNRNGDLVNGSYDEYVLNPTASFNSESVLAISMGFEFACAIMTDSRVKCGGLDGNLSSGYSVLGVALPEGHDVTPGNSPKTSTAVYVMKGYY